jgi:hypothetical protein
MICIAESLSSIVSSDIPIGPISDEAANAIAAMLLELVERTHNQTQGGASND